MAEHCWGIRALYAQLADLTIPATILSTLLGRAQRLFDLALALPRRPADLRHRDPRRLPARADGADALGVHAARARLIEHHLRPGPDPHRAGPVLHDAVLPQLLRQHPRRPDQGGAHRRRRLLAHLLAHHPAAVAADPDRHRDLAVHRHLERIPLRRRLHRPASSSRSPRR